MTDVVGHGAVEPGRVVPGQQVACEVGLVDVDAAVDDRDDRAGARAAAAIAGPAWTASYCQSKRMPVAGIDRIELVSLRGECSIGIGERDARVVGGEVGHGRAVRGHERELSDGAQDLERAGVRTQLGGDGIEVGAGLDAHDDARRAARRERERRAGVDRLERRERRGQIERRGGRTPDLRARRNGEREQDNGDQHDPSKRAMHSASR